MGISLSPEQKAQLKREDSLVLPLAGANGADSATFHNPETGQEFFNQPVDPRALVHRIRDRGLQMGPASPELKAKWAAGEEERRAEDDAMVSGYESSEQHQVDLADRTSQFNDAVTQAVAQVLETLGVKVPDEERQAHPQEEEAQEVESHQLDFFEAVDAPTESETKLIVSQASRPELHLVE